MNSVCSAVLLIASTRRLLLLLSWVALASASLLSSVLDSSADDS